MRYAITIPALLFLAGCSSFTKHMVGQFEAERDFIVVEEDGTVYWSPHNSPYPQPHDGAANRRATEFERATSK